MEQKFTEIKEILKENRVVLFMKGNKKFPMCGFSSAVVNILGKHGVDFYDINILEDQEMREAIKKYTDWPTIPQLYIDNEFIGGCDIIREMEQEGELEGLLKEKGL